MVHTLRFQYHLGIARVGSNPAVSVPFFQFQILFARFRVPSLFVHKDCVMFLGSFLLAKFCLWNNTGNLHFFVALDLGSATELRAARS